MLSQWCFRDHDLSCWCINSSPSLRVVPNWTGGLSCPPPATAEVSLTAGGSCLHWESSAQGSGAAEVPSSCSGCSAEGWILAFARPYVKHRHRLFELHKHWWVHMKWRKCKAFKLGFSSWNPSGWRSFCQTDAPGHNFSQSPHYQLFIKAQLLIFFWDSCAISWWSQEITMHQIILTWIISDIKVSSATWNSMGHWSCTESPAMPSVASSL